jgi:uncharacterized membrane protein
MAQGVYMGSCHSVECDTNEIASRFHIYAWRYTIVTAPHHHVKSRVAILSIGLDRQFSRATNSLAMNDLRSRGGPQFWSNQVQGASFIFGPPATPILD